MNNEMIDNFQKWIDELGKNAVQEKRDKAKAAGDETKWGQYYWYATDKNKAIKAKFMDEGKKLGYESRYLTNPGEWLYDFIWREFDEDSNFTRVILAMEIEMSDMKERHIKYDFDKIVQADSDYKVMVFQMNTLDEVETIFTHFEKSATHYRSAFQSEYLLCGWVTSLNQFKFHPFTA